MFTEIGISLGSNLGNRNEAFDIALIRLVQSGVTITAVSNRIETAPVGFNSQHSFLNMAITGTTVLAAKELLLKMKNIELEMGRQRSISGYSDRSIDLDLIFYGNEIISGEDIIVPHPRMQERMFVLEPLFQVAPQWFHPVLKKTVREMRENLLNGENV